MDASSSETKGHGPHDWSFASHQPLGIAHASSKLRGDESTSLSSHPIAGNDIRTDTCKVASLSPCEDDFSHGEIEVVEGEKWRYWGVYDGHSGWATSKILSGTLAQRVARHLRKLPEDKIRDAESVKSAFETAFTELDDEIMSDGIDAMSKDIPHSEAMCRIAPTSSGSCATLVFLDPVSSVLHVACAGDSRAVLGRSNKPDRGWTAVALSTDQTGSNPDEVARINAEHPGETPIEGGRVLDCEVTRSFGDSRWKWPYESILLWQYKFFGLDFKKNYKTPPYITAKPTMENAAVTPGSFLILATDGFWNHMASNEDAVHCVTMWLEHQPKPKGEDAEDSTPHHKHTSPEGPSGYSYNWKVSRDDFIVENDNAATHLVRNAFGGRNADLFCSMMSLKSPDSKQARDDTTAIVVFF